MNASCLRRLAGFGLLLANASAFGALPAPNLDIYVSGAIFDRGLPGNTSSDFIQTQDIAAGPLQAGVQAGAVFTHACTFASPFCSMQTTVFSRASSLANYGVNAAAIKNGLRPANGTDLGTLPQGTLVDGIGAFGFGLPVESSAQSSWTDTFVVFGGPIGALATATIQVSFGGSAATGYGENGTAFYDAEPAFQAFGTKGAGSVHYGMDVRYAVAPIDFGSDGPNPPIRFEQSWGGALGQPLPTSHAILGDAHETLSGQVLFRYGEAFSLTSSLSLNGYHQIDFDYSHTARLSLFDLPDGAFLASGSGFEYETQLAIPEPQTYALLLAGLGLLGFAARRRAKAG